jgi:hypothetical protein
MVGIALATAAGSQRHDSSSPVGRVGRPATNLCEGHGPFLIQEYLSLCNLPGPRDTKTSKCSQLLVRLGIVIEIN